MLRKTLELQTQLEMVTLDGLVPECHLVRKLLKVIDFSFIYDRVEHLYSSDNGRPALDPVMMFKALFLGYLFGVRSERQLVREIEVNVAYRWFLGLSLTDKVFDASTFSQNRRRRFNESDIPQAIFDEIVVQAMKRGLVDGSVLYTDSTHLKANANKAKYDLSVVEKSRMDYLDRLDAAIEQDRATHNKKPLKEPLPNETETKEIKVSRTDPQSGYMVRDDKPKGFFYLDHRTVDSKFSIITDSFVTPANVHDSVPYLSRLDRQRETFGFVVKAVGLDAGYASAVIAEGLETREILGVTGYKRPNSVKGMLYKREFVYDKQADVYHCPQGQALAYSTTDRTGYRHYKSNPKLCKDCPLLASCTTSRNQTKVVTRHVWQEYREKVDSHRLTHWGKAIYKRRKETVERSFADAKQLFGHRYAKMRGLARVTEQCLLAAASQNMKKIALCCA